MARTIPVTVNVPVKSVQKSLMGLGIGLCRHEKWVRPISSEHQLSQTKDELTFRMNTGIARCLCGWIGLLDDYESHLNHVVGIRALDGPATMREALEGDGGAPSADPKKRRTPLASRPAKPSAS